MKKKINNTIIEMEKVLEDLKSNLNTEEIKEIQIYINEISNSLQIFDDIFKNDSNLEKVISKNIIKDNKRWQEKL